MDEYTDYRIFGLFSVPSSLSQLIGTLDYEDSSVLDSIPEREWRLLAALARKREEDDEREKLADQFRKMWQKEKEERDLVRFFDLQHLNYFYIVVVYLPSGNMCLKGDSSPSVAA